MNRKPAASSFQNPLRSWINEFLFIREHFNGVQGKPLYSYQVSSEEFRALEQLLASSPPSRYQDTYDPFWAAGFCLFVAEWYRRDYNKDWSWTEPERRVGRSFNTSQHSELIKRGLVEFWKRPIRQRERGRDLLGSLFVEGGLPWQLVQSETHGFGRAVRRGLRNYYRTRTGLRSTADLMEESLDSLPLAFRNLETRQILAGIVEQLMHLAEQFPLDSQKDPALYLDEHCPGWKEVFPIPLDESNARHLINEWLKDAGQRQQERKNAEALASAFSCEHRLCGTEYDWAITTELSLPKRTDIPKVTNLSSTRLELGYYEGDTLIARGGAVYAQIDNEQMGIRFPETTIRLQRRTIDQPVSLRLLENGQPVHSFYFDGSAIELADAPMFFERREDEWYLTAQASCKMQGQEAKIRLPVKARIINGTVNLLTKETCGAQWLHTNDNISVCMGSDIYSLSLGCGFQTTIQPALAGVLSLYESREHAVFMGFPTLNLPEDFPYRLDELHCSINGKATSLSRQAGKAGVFRLAVKNQLGEILLRRRIGVLPDGFAISLFPSGKDKPARIKIRNGKDLLIQIVGDNLTGKEVHCEHDRFIYLEHCGPDAPTLFRMEVSSDASSEPVTLIFPYPYHGVRMFGQHGETLNIQELTINDLVGLQLALFSGQSQGQKFHLHLDLQTPPGAGTTPGLPGQRPSRYYRIDVGEEPKLVSLFSYQNDIEQLLGAVNNQDAYVRLTLESSERLLNLNIRRYSGYANREAEHLFSIQAMDGKHSLPTTPTVEAMQLSDPKHAPISVTEKVSENVGTGLFEIPESMNKNGPWMIYPTTDTVFQFRPFVHVTEQSDTGTQDISPKSLHRAAQLFHPQHNPDVIDDQIALMAEDFNHSGWQYLAELKSNYGHLPLSVFESWQSLANNTRALATAVFRLEIDERFCNRIRDELAVIWESIPLPVWHTTFTRFSDWLDSQGLPEVMIKNLKENRRNILHTTVSGFEHLGDYITTGDLYSLPKIPPVDQILQIWYQGLRQTHQSNSRWPVELADELSAWVRQQNLPALVKNLSQIHFSDSVVYLPIFMAYITAGKVSLEDLKEDVAYLKFVIRMISDFDRSNWYTPVHSMMVAYLLKTSEPE